MVAGGAGFGTGVLWTLPSGINSDLPDIMYVFKYLIIVSR